jgi:hypothetical protein
MLTARSLELISWGCSDDVCEAIVGDDNDDAGRDDDDLRHSRNSTLSSSVRSFSDISESGLYSVSV